MTGFFRDLERLERGADAATAPARLREQHLALLADVACVLSSVTDVHELGKVFLRRLVALVSADRALLFLARDDAPVRFVLGMDRDGAPVFGQAAGHEQEIVARVVAAGQPVLAGGRAAGPDADAGEVAAEAACLCVPLESHRGRIGAVFVERAFGREPLTAEDLLAARLVAVQASLSIELLRLEADKREAERVALENEHLRRLSRRTVDEARVIEELNRELKGRSEKLTATTAFLSGILESSTQYAIVATDLDGTITTWNAGAVRTYGFEARDVVACARLDALFCEADQRAGLFRELVEAAKGPSGRHEGEVRRVRNDGTPISVHAATTAIRDADGGVVGFLDVSRDVTRECEMRGQMLLAEKMAALGTLCAGVAHEFNNLLQGIVGFLEHAQQSGAEVVKDRAICVSLAAARRAADLTGQLKAVARPTTSRPAPVMLADLVAEALALVEKSFSSEGVDLLAEHAPSSAAFVDRSRIQQVLLNLVTNARHAVRDATRKRVTVRTAQEGAWCVIEVEDTGCGMSPEVQRRVFEPFFTTKGALGGTVYDGKIHGTGLGLAISQGIVAESGGRIHLASEEGKGTTFRVLLPATEEPALPRSEDRARAASQKAERRLRVLVADDEAPIRELLKSVLTLRGHDVVCVADGEEGRIAFGVDGYDVVIADYQMPRTNGAEFLASLPAPANGRPCRRILVTGLPPSELAMPEGLDLLLEKPYSVRDVVAAVEGRLLPAAP
jgi:PAS domain S-box-containing protein